MSAERTDLGALARGRGEAMVELTRALVRIDSQTPPSATGAAAERVAAALADLPHVTVDVVESVSPVVNVVAELDGGSPGPRLILNGHLDTYPIGAGWTRDPLGAEIADGRLYGRGSGDMKGGLAVLVEAFRVAAEHLRPFPGSLVLALAGDEERMGELGTQWLIDNDPRVRGDAVLVADVGGPRAIRLGEKGMIWLELQAEGRAAHGAHVHAGVNAVDRLLDAIADLRQLERLVPDEPPDAASVMDMAAGQPGADGSAARATMRRVTVNVGEIHGGTSPNLVADSARAGLDIRVPLGVTVTEVQDAIASALAGREGITYDVTRRYEPSWTPAESPIVRAALEGVSRALGAPVWADMRIGGSDARLWRRAGYPCLVIGPTANNLGAPDEYVLIHELEDLLFSYLSTIHLFHHEDERLA